MQNNTDKTFEEELMENMEDADGEEKISGMEENEDGVYTYIPQSFEPQLPNETKIISEDIKKIGNDTNKMLLDFSALLDTLSSLEDKKKLLWKQIYENAITDRRNSYILFGDLITYVLCNPNEHAIHGATLSKYMERMEKSNSQLIKLAEMIDEVAENEAGWVADEDKMYDRILKMNK